MKTPETYRLHVYVCRRWDWGIDDWMGALIVAASNEDEAIATCIKHEGVAPLSTEIMPAVLAAGETRVLYDDQER